jgi:hypothetical protein
MKMTLPVVLTLCCISTAVAQDHTLPAGPAGVDMKLLAENEFVQVLRMSIPGGFKTPMHDVTPRVVVWLSDAHFVDHFADGKAQEETRRAGDAEWISARRHAGQNLSDRPMEFIAVIMKGPAAGAHHRPPH